MSPSAPPLPACPAGFSRFAWHGIALALPDSWNLAFHAGDARKGMLRFADLRAVRLELRWKSPPRLARLLRRPPEQALAHTITSLRPKENVETLPSGGFRVARENGRLILAADQRRLYELSFFSPAALEEEAVIQDFLTTTPPLAETALWPWSVYGAQGPVPARARLIKTSLLPGESRLLFRHRGHRIELAARSLADRLLAIPGPAGQSALRAWATTLPFIRDHAAGHWQENGQHVQYRVHELRFLRKPREHDFKFAHDPLTNQIRWTHHA